MRLFEMTERLDEVEVRNIKGICVLVADHVYDRMATRKAVTPEVLNTLLKRIPDVKNKYKPLATGTPTKLWSKSLNLGLGIRKLEDKDGYQRLLVSTVLDKPLFDNVDDVIFYVG